MIPLRLSVLSASKPARGRVPRSSWIAVAVLVSLLLHGGIIGLLTVAGRRQPAPPPVEGTVELLMVENKGATANNGGPPPAPPQPEVKPRTEPKPRAAAPSPPPAAPTPVAKTGEVPAPPLTPPSPEPVKPPPPEPQPSAPKTAEKTEKTEPAPPEKPVPPAPQKAPVFNLSGTDSDTNAEVISGNILPASPDNRFRNRPPPYPDEAARRGEHGTVTVSIHVGADGTPEGVDILESSGFPALDSAAVTAVRTWRFHPALRDSQPVPFDMTFRFVFRDN